MQFGHGVIDGSPPCGHLGICHPTNLTGNSRSDIYVAEIRFGKRENEACYLIFPNQSDGEFEETLIHRGTSTHEANAIDTNDDGRADIVDKSYKAHPRRNLAQ